MQNDLEPKHFTSLILLFVVGLISSAMVYTFEHQVVLTQF